ncbi:hypothetical protein P170DRAFT_404656 [Aspergillus steynii IBT 23096]|uniref:Zn(2)-C6 fungal-type domain-containing protein n=1 Tax=Aspergillus steynii IBT 23096 TaxID=1392250 RepID=A0A2I2GAS6_9EURO|nr:uncharacterized protein P170DRAFT_404656 [Aspergillus steynii IBT 23096]PLB49975.1 hypothetical protein P170DRAFT_404656 [Aspergillus steynii IBT 23096]
MPDKVEGVKPHACVNCSRAKAKCVWLDKDNGICQRCSKHDLACSKSDSVSKRRRGKATHSKVLEQKLDDIMNFLTREKDHALSPVQPAERSSTPCEAGGSATEPQTSHQPQPLAQPSDYAATKMLQGSISIVPGFEISFYEADQALHEYRKTMVPELPFVPLPTENSTILLKEKPLLLKTILSVCRPPSPEISAVFQTWFRQQIADETVVLMNKNVELIQAILVYLAWNDIYFYALAKDTSLLQLAIGLIEDLRLNRSQNTSDHSCGSIVEDAAQLRNDVQPQPNQTNEDQRTLLGVYYLTSTLCSLLGKRNRLEYTAHFDDCCKQLERDQSFTTDSLLVNLVRIQRITTKVSDCYRESIINTTNGPIGGLHSMTVISIENELESFMKQLPTEVKWNHLLQTHYAAARIRLFEPFKYGERNQTIEFAHIRRQMIWQCLSSTQALLEAFRTVPVQSYLSLTFVSILHAALAIIKCFRLLTVDDQAWDASVARSMYNLPQSLDQLSRLFDAASSSGSPRSGIILNGRPMFSEYAEAYRGIGRWYLTKVDASAVRSSPTLEEPFNTYGVDPYGFDFWTQLSELTNGLVP